MDPARKPSVSVVMALYHPDLLRLEQQIRSIRAQSGVEVKLHLFADGPMPQVQAVAELASPLADVTFEIFETNRGPAATFIAGLERTLETDPGAGYLAFADQDDVWFEDKLARSIAALEAAGAGAVHTDAALVDGSGEPIAPSLFHYEDRDIDPSLKRLFFRNNATGMTMTMTRDLAAQIIALRDHRPSAWLHDHFAAFLASAGDGLAFLPEPTVHYVQHGANVIGANAGSGVLPTGGGFRTAGGRTDQILQQGLALIETLLASDWPNPRARTQLVQLQTLLRGRGIADLVSNAAELAALTHNVRPLMARLAWVKLTSHRWQ